VKVSQLLETAEATSWPDRRDFLLDILDIDKEWRMHEVSDGERKRVQLLLGLVKPFDILLLDEVTVDLDLIVRQDLLRFLKNETERRGATIVYATHILDGLSSWPTHLAHLNNGELVEAMPIEQLLSPFYDRAREEQEQEQAKSEDQNKVQEEQKLEDKNKEETERNEDRPVLEKQEVIEDIQKRKSSENIVKEPENQGLVIHHADPEDNIQVKPPSFSHAKDPEEVITEYKPEVTTSSKKSSTEYIKEPLSGIEKPPHSSSKIEKEKQRFLDEFEYGDIKSNEPVKEEIPEVKPPKFESPKVELPKVEPPKFEPPKVEPPKVEEEIPKKIENIELPPPKTVFMPQNQGHRDQETKIITAARSKEREVAQKPKPIMFIPTTQNITSSFQSKVQEKVQEKAQHKVFTPVLESDINMKDPADSSLIVRFKKDRD